MRWVLFWIIGALLVLSAFAMSRQASAHTIRWPDGQSFDFTESGCCNGWECDAAPLDAIKEVAGGYQVDFWRETGTPKRNRHYRDFVPSTDKRVKNNPFGDRIMICVSPSSNPMAPTDDHQTYKVQCIWPVKPTT